MITLEFNMDIFILAKIMEMDEIEKESLILEMFYNIYCVIFGKLLR